MPLEDVVIENTPLYFCSEQSGVKLSGQEMSEKENVQRKESALRGTEEVSRVDVSVRELSVRDVGAGTVVRDMFFEGGNVLRCYAGRFRFMLGDGETVEIGTGEALVTYPGQRVTIEALEKQNLLRYAIFVGDGVSAYFDGFGFYDGLHGRTSAQLEVFESIRRQMRGKTNLQQVEILVQMRDALVTYAHDFRENGNPLVYDAIWQIRKNLREGIVRLKDLCEDLEVSRSHLHRAFVAQGLGSVASFVKGEQVRLALQLLRDTRLSVAEIARQVGFTSVPHFATFIKQRTGKPPRDLRR